ncbi:MAG: hypothetical protein VYE77_04345 [Planctomycetota bacterium]|nr:hypothetical protein [Planctomycetota bacterium]
MTSRLLVAVLAIPACGLAQSPLTTTFANNNGGAVGGVVFFNLTVGPTELTIGALELNSFGPPGVTGTADVFLIPGGNYAGNEASGVNIWGTTPAATAPIVTQPSGTPTFAPLDTSLTLAAGSTNGIAIVANGWQHAYTNGDGVIGVPGSGSNQTYTNTDMQFDGGAASNMAFVSPVLDPRISNVSIHYVLGPGPLVSAISTAFGEGCYDLSATYYEQFAGPVDLAGSPGQSGTSILMTPNGIDGYVVSPGSGQWFGSNSTGTNNVPNAVPGTAPLAAPLATGDDTILPLNLSVLAPGFELTAVPGAPGPWTDLYVDSNGQMSVDASLSSDFSPSVQELLNEQVRWAPLWKDLTPTTQGSIYFSYDGNSCYLTWHNVTSFGQPSGNPGHTFQVAFMPGGQVEYRYETLPPIGQTLIGFSSGNGASDPMSTDISASLAAGFDIGGTAVPPTLSADRRPLMGSTVNLTIADIHRNATLGSLLISFVSTPQGVDLGPFGMAGCNGYIDPLLNQSYSLFTPTAGSETVAFTNPTNSIYLGAEIFYQAVLLVPSAPNFLGGNVTNALHHRLGTL